MFTKELRERKLGIYKNNYYLRHLIRITLKKGKRINKIRKVIILF